jgi:integrating conjugative element protein (TIGR03755 family)
MLIRERPGMWYAAAFFSVACALLGGVARSQTIIDRDSVQVTGSVIGDDVLYSIGGGRAVGMTRAPRMRSISIGVSWNSNLICGNLKQGVTLRNQLNGVTDGFQTIMSEIIENATAAVASLPALIIQRANPGLYNLLTNGILQARLDFDRSKLTCRGIGNRMADIAVDNFGWDQISEGMAMKDAAASNDAVAAVAQAEDSRGNNGVPWVGGTSAGGTGQDPILVVGDVTRAGYNLLNGRAVTDTAPIDAVDCDNRLTCQAWPSPDAAAAWANRVLGEQEQRTCEGCTRTQTMAGVGLTPLIQEEYDTRLEALQALVTGSQPITVAALEAAGSNAMPVSRGIIESLRDEPDQDLLAKRLASEIAVSSVLEKAMLLQGTLLAGRKEPNVAANQLAQNAVSRESELLHQDIDILRSQFELRRAFAGNAAKAILERHSERAEASRNTVEADDQPDRLNQIQKPGGRN